MPSTLIPGGKCAPLGSSERMRIVLLANNVVGQRVAEWLKQQDANVIGVVVHPPEAAKCRDGILKTLGLPESCQFDGAAINSQPAQAWLKELQPDLLLSVWFRYIIRRPILDIPRLGCLNLHPAYLPYNRGTYTNVWSIVEGTPAGVTLHFMDECIDTGDIVAQKQVSVTPTDTSETLLSKLVDVAPQVLIEAWPQIMEGCIPRRTQDPASGTTHRDRDIPELDRIDPTRTFTAQELVDLLRARTFPPYKGAYLDYGDYRVYVNVQLQEEKVIER